MSRKPKKTLVDWAQFRFSVIGGLLARPPNAGELRKELEKLAAEEYLHPTRDEWVSFGVSTIERWFYQARNVDDPIAALGRRIRSDFGYAKAMSPELVSALERQYGKNPSWSYKLPTT